MTQAFIELKRVTRHFNGPAGPFAALAGIDLAISEGECVAVVGKSGSGKSTLLNVLSGIDRPSTGEVWIGGTAVHKLSQDRAARWRGGNLGLVFQSFQLLPTLTAQENVMLPMDFCGTFAGGREARALALLERMGIADQARKLPASLSGGQQQRVAIARALANDPPLLLADEPTGNLDSRTAGDVLELFAGLSRLGKTVILVTHERDIEACADRTVTIAVGQIVLSSRELERV